MTQLNQLAPHDEHNQRLESNVHPPDWVNPTPADRYNLVVTAAGAAGLGAKVALIECDLMGGDCLNVGCVPSKWIISSARVAASVRGTGEFGVEVPEGASVNFPAVMQRMRRLRADISPHDSAARFRELGIDVFLGEGRFSGSETIRVDGKTRRFKRAVIATGTRAADSRTGLGGSPDERISVLAHRAGGDRRRADWLRVGPVFYPLWIGRPLD